jgi:hypothetical protein
VIRLRRATALTLALLLIQLVLVGGGFSCEDVEQAVGATTANVAMADMRGMAMDGAAESPSSNSRESDPAPCNLPWAPNGCTLMIPCAPHAVTAQVQPIYSVEPANQAVVALEIAAPLSAIIALDTPPPRA